MNESLSAHIKEHAPGWNVRRLAKRLGYSEHGLQKMYREHPERFELWLAGLKQEEKPQEKK